MCKERPGWVGVPEGPKQQTIPKCDPISDPRKDNPEASLGGASSGRQAGLLSPEALAQCPAPRGRPSRRPGTSGCV